MTELSQTDYAKLRGWSAAYVSKLKRQGRLVLTPAGTVNVEATDRLVEQTRDPARGGDRRPSAEATPAEHVVSPAGAHSADSAGAGKAPKGGGDTGYQAAATRERVAKARIAELELAELAGALVRRDDVERLVFALAREAMDKLLSMPDRVSGQLATESDPWKCSRLLEDELRRVCDAMAKVDRLLDGTAEAAAA